MVAQCKTYDLILYRVSHRVNGYYLNIIKHLSDRLSIGVVSGKTKAKTATTESQFSMLCRKFGATILHSGKEHACNLLLVPQDDYTHMPATKISRNKVVILHRFGSGATGLVQLKKMGANKIWVYEKQLFVDALPTDTKNGCAIKSALFGLDIVEMGSPYARYPAFDFSDLGIDYIVAFPTPMLMRKIPSKLRLLQNMLSLIDSTSGNIYLKPHNVVDGGYNMSKNNFHSNVACSIISSLPDGLVSLIPDKLYELCVNTLQRTVKSKTIPLSLVTDKYNLGIEHFIPFVKKGIITGISSCIWHAMYNNVPVFNCDDRPLWKDMPNYTVYNNFKVGISDTARKADLIKLIKEEL